MSARQTPSALPGPKSQQNENKFCFVRESQFSLSGDEAEIKLDWAWSSLMVIRSGFSYDDGLCSLKHLYEY